MDPLDHYLNTVSTKAVRAADCVKGTLSLRRRRALLGREFWPIERSINS